MTFGYIPLDDAARSGQIIVVSNPETGDLAQAFWTGEMWAYGPATPTVEQLHFEPTHYRPRP